MSTAVGIFAIIGVCVCILGLIGTWVRNGRSQTAKFATLQTHVEGISKKLEDPAHGLGALSEKLGNFQTDCAFTRAGYDERIKGAQEDIKELKRKRK